MSLILGYDISGNPSYEVFDIDGKKLTSVYDADGNIISSDLVKLSETDGDANTALLNSLLREGNVTLETGEYPVAPGILVDGRTLDLNGSHLTSTELRFTGALVGLAGDSPCIKNGWLSGLYSAAPGEDGYEKFEGESAIRFKSGGFTNATIKDLKINNFCGFSVVPGASSQLTESVAIRHVSPVNEPENGEFIVSVLSSDYPYVAAKHSIGYKYYISDEPVRYTFVDSNGSTIAVKYGIPGEAILKPEGTAAVYVHTTIETYVQYGLYEYKYDNSMLIENCDFYCNQRLAIANLPGFSRVINCRSRSNGYPREDHTNITWDDSTTGFIDIEDVQTPRMLVDKCSSSNENLGIASRVFDLTVTDSPDVRTGLHQGWTANIVNSGMVSYSAADAAYRVELTIGGTTTMNIKFVRDKKNRTDKYIGNIHIVPNEDAVYENCTYENTDTGFLWYGNKAIGTFSNCTFNLGAGWMYSRGTFNLTFKNCTINTNGHYLVEQRQSNSSYLTFENCTIDDESKITTGLPVTVTIKNSGGTS